MKANELMIGDWVSHRGKPKQVVYIYCRPMPNGEYPANEIGFTHNEDEWIDADHAEPVPLTEEILKANGFGIKDNFAFVQNWDCYISIDLTNMLCGEIRSGHEDMGCYMRFNFVHKLQHALRLCGLTDLADNFKLKADE